MGKKRIRAEERIGHKFGRLLVQAVEKRTSNAGIKISVAVCLCDCGGDYRTDMSGVVLGATKSCGCLKRETSRKTGLSNETHGQTKGSKTSNTYKVWAGIKNRCTSKISRDYANWGARGIKVCDRWVNSFENFLADMGEQPKGLTLDRKDNNLGYSKENCRWATWREQARNRRNSKLLTMGGTTKTLAEWLETFPTLRHDTVSMRLKRGWSVQDSLLTPVKSYRPPNVPIKKVEASQK